MNRGVRKQFASSIATKFQQLPEISSNMKIKWLLFQTAMISSAIKCCGQKRFRMEEDSKKKHFGRNKVLKMLSEQKKKMRLRSCCKRGFHLFVIPVFQGVKNFSSISKNVQRTLLGEI